MAGLNSTGQPNTNDYNLGRGAVYFATNNSSTGLPLAYRHLGNAPEFNINLEVETLEHQASLSGLKTTDKEVTVSQTLGLSLSLDEINFQNLAIFMSGNTASHTNITAVATQLYPLADTGRWYDIYDSNGNRVYDITAASDVVVSDQTPSSSTLTLTTDYLLDLVMGRVFLNSTATGFVSGTDTLQIDYTATGTPIANIDEVEALTTTTVAGALKFVGENPTDADHQQEFQFHQVSLKAEGDFSLIGDDFTVMQLTGKAEKNTGTAAAVSQKTLTIRTHADA